MWISILKLKPITDQIKIHEITLDFLSGKIDFHLSDTQYLFLYPYQMGLVLFVSFLYKLLGTNYMIIEYLNAICSIINFYILYLISQNLFKDKITQKYVILLLTGFSFYWMFFNVHFYGNIIGLTFALLSVLFTLKYLEKNKFYFLLLIGILSGISILIKSNYAIFLCGIIIVLLLDMIEHWNIQKLFIIPIVIIGYMGINVAYHAILEKKYEIHLPDGVPMINFIYMGMTDDPNFYPGWYNGKTIELYFGNNCDTEKTSREALRLINERVTYFKNNPTQFFIFYAKKIGSTWLNPTFQTIWCSTPGMRYVWDTDYASYITNHKIILDMVSSYGKLYELEENYFNIYQIVVFIFSAIGIFLLAKDQQLMLKSAILPIIFFGRFFISYSLGNKSHLCYSILLSFNSICCLWITSKYKYNNSSLSNNKKYKREMKFFISLLN